MGKMGRCLARIGALFKKPQFYSFLALICLFANYALVLILNDYASRERYIIIPEMILWSSLGAVAGGLLCPLFLPLPFGSGKSGTVKPACSADRTSRISRRFISIVFILLIMIPNIILRLFGIDLWLSSIAACALIHLLTGALYPVCCGLLIFSFLKIDKQPVENFLGSQNLTGKYCVFLFSIAWGSILLIRYISLPLFDFLGFGTDPLTSATLAYNINTVLMACICVFVIVSLLTMEEGETREKGKGKREKDMKDDHSSEINRNPAASLLPFPFSLKSPFSLNIVILISLTVLYQLINTLLEMRFHFFPLTYISGTDLFRFLSLAIIVSVLGFIAGFSIKKFLRFFLPFAVVLFILLPCLLLFDDNPPVFVLIIRDITGTVVYRMIAVIFTVAIVEEYLTVIKNKKRQGYWFYMLAGYFNITNILWIFSFNLGRLIPAGTGYMVLILGLAAIAAMILSARIILPKQNPASPAAVIPAQDEPHINDTHIRPIAITGTIDEIFSKHDLTKREKEVAYLMITEGLKDKEIGERLYISHDTVRSHVKCIYQKFFVNSRGEFISLFVSKRD